MIGKAGFLSTLSLKIINSNGAFVKSSLASANGTDHQTCRAVLMLTFKCKLCLISNSARPYTRAERQHSSILMGKKRDSLTGRG